MLHLKMHEILGDLGNIVLRSTSVYLFMIFAFRIFGKRELSQLSIADLVLIVLISNAVQNAMVGDNTTLWGGLTAAATLFILNMIFGWMMYRFSSLRRIIQSEPITLIYQGKIIQDNLRRILLTQEELLASVREHGVEDIANVKLAVLETDGNISIISIEKNQWQEGKLAKKHHHKSQKI